MRRRATHRKKPWKLRWKYVVVLGWDVIIYRTNSQNRAREYATRLRNRTEKAVEVMTRSKALNLGIIDVGRKYLPMPR